MIDRIRYRGYAVKRRNVFRIATCASDVEDNIVVRVDSGDEFGVGNASPSDVTNETKESIEAFMFASAKRLRGVDEDDIPSLHTALESIAPGNTAAKAAIDMAVHDLVSKRDGRPLYRTLGGEGDGRALTDMTVGIEDEEETVRRAVASVNDGFRALKLKVGLDLGQDIRRVAAVRDAVGPGVELRVDANQGYDVEQAVAFCEEMGSLGVSLVEQPVDADDHAGLKTVKARSPVPIMADECLKTIEDAERVAADGSADIINIKLMKSGGIHPARAIDAIARDAGIPTMIGCMGEIQLSIAAGLHFALSSGNVRYVDLDSHFSMVDDPSSGLTFDDGLIGVSDRPGLGVRTGMDD